MAGWRSMISWKSVGMATRRASWSILDLTSTERFPGSKPILVGSWINVLGIARIDVADRLAYRALLAALEGRQERSSLEMPFIEY
jgi:hypothetical protein